MVVMQCQAETKLLGHTKPIRCHEPALPGEELCAQHYAMLKQFEERRGKSMFERLRKALEEKPGGEEMDKHEVESLAKDALENNPISAHCDRVLENPPSCVDFRGARGFTMCFAWKLMEDEKIGLSPALKRAWAEFRKVCPQE